MKRFMHYQLKIFSVLFFSLSFFSVYGQVKANNLDTTNNLDTKCKFSGDTLFCSNKIIITKGQLLTVGKGSAENGWYHWVGFQSPFHWRSWLFKDAELKNSYADNEQSRENDLVRDALLEGKRLIVTKLKREGNSNIGYWYRVYLSETAFPKTHYVSNILQALKDKEIIITGK